jgi:phosphoglycolate phosphatase/pyrophosphatase PpaX
MKVKCLILDHDDTLVKSTPEIHYPSFVEIMKRFCPDRPLPSLEEFMEFCSEPGYFDYCVKTLRFTPEVYREQDEMWHAYVETHIPDVYEGFPELLRDFTAQGGTVCVCSHSETRIILRDYEANGLPRPTLVFAAELGEQYRKPNPWPIEEIERRLGFARDEMAMVDDLMTGIRMAKNCGVCAVAAGWGHISPKIRQRVAESCDVYCSTVAELRAFLFEEENSAC